MTPIINLSAIINPAGIQLKTTSSSSAAQAQCFISTETVKVKRRSGVLEKPPQQEGDKQRRGLREYGVRRREE